MQYTNPLQLCMLNVYMSTCYYFLFTSAVHQHIESILHVIHNSPVCWIVTALCLMFNYIWFSSSSVLVHERCGHKNALLAHLLDFSGQGQQRPSILTSWKWIVQLELSCAAASKYLHLCHILCKEVIQKMDRTMKLNVDRFVEFYWVTWLPSQWLTSIPRHFQSDQYYNGYSVNTSRVALN